MATARRKESVDTPPRGGRRDLWGALETVFGSVPGFLPLYYVRVVEAFQRHCVKPDPFRGTVIVREQDAASLTKRYASRIEVVNHVSPIRITGGPESDPIGKYVAAFADGLDREAWSPDLHAHPCLGTSNTQIRRTYHIEQDDLLALALALGLPVPNGLWADRPELAAIAAHVKQPPIGNDLWLLPHATRLVFGDIGHTWHIERALLSRLGLYTDFAATWPSDTYDGYVALLRSRKRTPLDRMDFLLGHTLEYDLSIKAIAAGNIAAEEDDKAGTHRVTPASYLDWVREQGFDIPPMMESHLTGRRGIVRQKPDKKHGNTVNAEDRRALVVAAAQSLLDEDPDQYRHRAGSREGNPNASRLAEALEDESFKLFPDKEAPLCIENMRRIIGAAIKNGTLN